ncbi:HXXEE domain-containing protein [Streptosporangium sp. NPDC020145]|uniref:HXXEE domain-containing protein n=1 Tax=Streptosporangium sp. NPDC020145 TaxID=3154694 RepID=UPI0034157F29
MFSTFDLEFAWIGLGAAIVLTAALLTTDALRGGRALPRWKDPTWLGWVAVVVYLFHNIEEYGIAADGAHHAFPDFLCTTLNRGAYPECPIPTEFYLFVNIGLVWVVAVICALLAGKYVMMGFAFYSIVIVNCFVHIVPALATGTYNPGLLTAVVMFLPASAWMIGVFLKHQDPPLGKWRLLGIVGIGVAAHGALLLTINLFLNDVISGPVLDLLQLLNAGLVLLVGALLQRSLPPAHAATAKTGTQAAR